MRLRVRPRPFTRYPFIHRGSNARPAGSPCNDAQNGTGTMSEQMENDAFHEKSEVPITGGLYYLGFLLVATLTMLLFAGGVIG